MLLGTAHRVFLFLLLIGAGCGESGDPSVRATAGGDGGASGAAPVGGSSGAGGAPAGSGGSTGIGGGQGGGGVAGSLGGGSGGGAPSDSGSDANSGEGGASIPTWKTLAPLAGGPRQETGVAALGGKIYVVGGITPVWTAVTTVEVYDPATNAWSTAAPLPKPMNHANTAAVNGKLYVIGGLDASLHPMGDVFAYDPSNGWSSKTPLPAGTERGGSGVAVIGAAIYVAGGFRTTSVADFSVYDTELDMHVPLPPLPARRDHLVGGAIGNVVYAIGGRVDPTYTFYPMVDAFDVMTKSWLPGVPVMTPRAGAAAAVIGDRIVVAGGEGNVVSPLGVFRETEAFVSSTISWLSLPDMLTPRHGTGAAAIGNVFYVPGGATKGGVAATAVVEALEL